MNQNKRITEIIDKTAQGFGLSKRVMMSRCRHQDIAIPRMTAMAFAREDGFTFAGIGRHFKRDHGSAINAYKSITNLAETNPQFLKKIRKIWSELQES
jgi:chromosomal replication initiation ATPase DnaA